MPVLYFIIGACFASFIPCFAERRRNQTSQFERSHCLNCGTPIAPLYLIPIFGYFFSHGRCKSCQIAIPKIFPILELAGALIGLLFALQSANTLQPMNQLLITSTLLLISLDDFYTQWIRDSDLLIYGTLLLCDAIFFNTLFWPERILGTCIITLPLLLIYWCFPHALGSGDIIFMALSGFYLGAIAITYAFLTGILIALFYSVWLLRRNQATKDTAIPLIPFLSIGILSGMLI